MQRCNLGQTHGASIPALTVLDFRQLRLLEASFDFLFKGLSAEAAHEVCDVFAAQVVGAVPHNPFNGLRWDPSICQKSAQTAICTFKLDWQQQSHVVVSKMQGWCLVHVARN